MPDINYVPINELPVKRDEETGITLDLPAAQPTTNLPELREIIANVGMVATTEGIQSYNFVINTTGWRLLSSGEIRGTSGVIGGWTLSATTLSSGNVTLDATNEQIRLGAATAPFTGIGIFMGSDGAAGYDFRAGDPAGQYIFWDASAGTLTVTGALIAGEIHIPDRNTTANSFHVNTAGTTWIGATEASFTASNENAQIYFLNTGVGFIRQNLQVGVSTGNFINIDGANQRIRSSTYVSGVSGFSIDPTLIEAQNILARGTLSGTVFRYDVISATGGRQVIANADALSVAMSALDASTLTIRGNVTLAVNDILVIRAQSSGGIQEEYLRVTAIGAAPTYTVTRDLAGTFAADTNPAWPAGTAVVQQGESDGAAAFSGGWLDLVGEATSGNWPRISVFQRTGVGATAFTERVRAGNLNGYVGYASDIYGFACGSSVAGEANITIDPTNGIRIRQGTTNRASFDMAGNATLFALNIEGSLNIFTSGNIRSGQTAYDTGTGFFLEYNGGTPRFSIGVDTGQKMTWDGTTYTVTGSLNHQRVYTAASAIAATDAVYLDTSTGNVAPTNANASSTVETFVGFAPAAIAGAATGRIQHENLVTGLSGLTVGQRYRCADSGSSDSDITVTGTGGSHQIRNSEGDSSFAATNISGVAYPFTISNRSKLTSITVSARKVEAPGPITGNFNCRVVRASGAFAGGARYYADRSGIVATATLAATSLTAALADVVFSFSGVVLTPDDYYIVLSRDVDNNTNYIEVEHNGGAGGYTYDHNPGAGWDAAAAPEISINYVNDTFAAGDITDYFFTNRQEIGVALSTTTLLIDRPPPRSATGSGPSSSSSSGDEEPSVSVSTITIGFLPRFIHINATITLRGVAGTMHGIYDVDAGTWQGNVNHTNVTSTINSDMQLGVFDSGGASEGYAYLAIGAFTETTFRVGTISANFTGGTTYGISSVAIKCIR